MRGLRCILLVLVLVGVTAALPASAQENPTIVPELAPLFAVRDRFVQTFNGQPLQVCASEWESWNRVHGVCNDLVSRDWPQQSLVAGRVVEFVVYDGIGYERIDDATTWSTQLDPLFDPDLTLTDALFTVSRSARLSRVGPAVVDGTAATQYQYWLLDADLNAQAGGQAVYVLFVSEEGYMLKSQFSSRGTIAGLGTGELAEIWQYTDFNVPIVVTPPAVSD